MTPVALLGAFQFQRNEPQPGLQEAPQETRGSDVAMLALPPQSYVIEDGSWLFDPAWYLLQNPDVAEAGVDPGVHFAERGLLEGRDPHPLFDTRWYVSRHPDVAASVVPPFWHYMQFGAAEARSPHMLFDAVFYRNHHRDDPDAVAHPLKHYVAHGLSHRHDPNPFFENGWYAGRHDTAGRSALEHFLLVGEDHDEKPHPLWNSELYFAVNPRLDRHTFNAYRHFIEHGAGEIEAGGDRLFRFAWGDLSLDYDRAAYLTDNPDVGTAIREGRVRNGLEHLFTVGFQEAIDGLRALYGPGHRCKLVRTVDGTALDGGRRLCLFAHYDRDGFVDPYVITYLEALRGQDVDVVFITATADDAALDSVLPYVRMVVVKNDVGRDFGSWWLALTTLGAEYLAPYERVIFANDSIYFPVAPVAPLFDDMEKKEFSLYGLADSHEFGHYHVQSYFLGFDREAQAVVFPWFIERFEQCYVLTKQGQIGEFEVGITRQVKQAGLAVGAFYSIDDGREDAFRLPELKRWGDAFRVGAVENASHDLWNLLIERYDWPALKVELLRDNPRNATGLKRVLSVIERGSVPYDVIKRHQRRVRRPAAAKPLSPALVRPEPLLAVREIVEGYQRKAAQRLVLFAHYDPDGLVDAHILHQLRELDRAGCDVVFITSIDDPTEIEKVRPFTRHVLIKTDTGRDFGSWYLALQQPVFRIETYAWVIWMNDSTYFPLFSVADMFSTMEALRLDFWGVVDSNNRDWHVMSWFWAFGQKARADGWFDWYLKEYNPAHTKWEQIHNYEMRLPRLIRANGGRCGTYVSVEDMREVVLGRYPDHPRIDCAVAGNFTMTHDFWEETIRDFRCPALKVELVRDNPLGRDLSLLLDVVRSCTDYDPDLIRNHVRRLKLRHLPPVTAADFHYTRN